MILVLTVLVGSEVVDVGGTCWRKVISIEMALSPTKSLLEVALKNCAWKTSFLLALFRPRGLRNFRLAKTMQSEEGQVPWPERCKMRSLVRL